MGMYCSENVQEELSSVSKSESKGKKAIAALRKGASENPTGKIEKIVFDSSG